MGYSYIRREESLEVMAARAVGEGADFARAYGEKGPAVTGVARLSVPRTLGRLEGGEVLDVRDDACLDAIGRTLVAAANRRRPRYGDHALRTCTHEDCILDPRLDELRDLLERWKSFRLVRNQLRARLAAQRLLAGN